MKLLQSALLAGMFLSWCSAAYAEPPVYVAKRTGAPLVMDGFLDEPAWRNADSVGPYVFPWYTAGDKEQTVAKILWDDERIYFSFQCEDGHIWADHFQHESSVSQDDCCEAFICAAPDGDQRLDYINYELNCIGTWLAHFHVKARGENYGKQEDFSDISVGRVIDGTCNDDSDADRGWTLEFSVPYSHFKDFAAEFPPRDGQVMYIGLHRCGGKTNPQYSQWSPSQTPKPSFHQPMDFGKVIFSAETVR